MLPWILSGSYNFYQFLIYQTHPTQSWYSKESPLFPDQTKSDGTTSWLLKPTNPKQLQVISNLFCPSDPSVCPSFRVLQTGHHPLPVVDLSIDPFNLLLAGLVRGAGLEALDLCDASGWGKIHSFGVIKKDHCGKMFPNLRLNCFFYETWNLMKSKLDKEDNFWPRLWVSKKEWEIWVIPKMAVYGNVSTWRDVTIWNHYNYLLHITH